MSSSPFALVLYLKNALNSHCYCCRRQEIVVVVETMLVLLILLMLYSLNYLNSLSNFVSKFFLNIIIKLKLTYDDSIFFKYINIGSIFFHFVKHFIFNFTKSSIFNFIIKVLILLKIIDSKKVKCTD